jgi:glycosyltransferase involved in cell wall biosynthesis
VRPTILVVIGDLEVGGTEHHLVGVLPALAREGFRLLVCTLTHGLGLAPRLRAGGVEVVPPPGPGALRRLPRRHRDPLLLPLAAARLWRVIRARRPDVVHLFLPAAYLVGGACALLAGHRTVVMSRRNLNRYQRRHRVFAWLERRLHRRVAAVLANSRAVHAELVREGVPPERLGLIHNGIDLDRFTGTPPRRELRARIGVAPSALVLVTLANLVPYKGHADLLAALAGVSGRLPPGWTLLCAGRDDGAGRALAARAQALGLADHVRWLGLRDDVPALLAASDIGILPSHEEGFSNSVLEGMAAGLPMVVTAVGGNVEAVQDGVSGRLVPPRDPEALGAAILELAHDPAGRRRLGDAGRARVAALFGLEACVARYRQLYAWLVAGQTGTLEEALAPPAPDAA